MSNADRCARKDCQGLRMVHDKHTHAFVEPAPQPAPSGDEAKVREIARRHVEAGYCCMTNAMVMAREAYAAGKADGARDNERDMVEYLLGLADDSEGRVTDALGSGRWREELAIARRGSEGT